MTFDVLSAWDNAINGHYRIKNNAIQHSPKGYLEFLKQAQKEIMEALTERKKETGKTIEEIEKEIRDR